VSVVNFAVSKDENFLSDKANHGFPNPTDVHVYTAMQHATRIGLSNLDPCLYFQTFFVLHFDKTRRNSVEPVGTPISDVRNETHTHTVVNFAVSKDENFLSDKANHGFPNPTDVHVYTAMQHATRIGLSNLDPCLYFQTFFVLHFDKTRRNSVEPVGTQISDVRNETHTHLQLWVLETQRTHLGRIEQPNMTFRQLYLLGEPI